MNRNQLIETIKLKKSFLCVGLDSDFSQIPEHLKEYPNPVVEFNRAIIDATKHFCVAYKPNTAFYECPDDYPALRQTISYIPKTHFSIADAKRADIGNTSARYARAFLDNEVGFGADAVTLHPYMGVDSIQPFLKTYPTKWAILLAITSNPSASDFELQTLASGEMLYEKVIKTAVHWANPDQLMFVVGATQGAHIKKARRLAPDYFFLVPGVGAQGGDLTEVFESASNKDIGLIVNVGRSIIYADSSVHFAEAARQCSFELQQQMETLMRRSHFI